MFSVACGWGGAPLSQPTYPLWMTWHCLSLSLYVSLLPSFLVDLHWAPLYYTYIPLVFSPPPSLPPASPLSKPPRRPSPALVPRFSFLTVITASDIFCAFSILLLPSYWVRSFFLVDGDARVCFSLSFLIRLSCVCATPCSRQRVVGGLQHTHTYIHVSPFFIFFLSLSRIFQRILSSLFFFFFL
jgi:hypothetical protein